MTPAELEMEVAQLKERVQILEEARKLADAWPPRGYVPMSDPLNPPPFHDPVLE